MDSNLETHMYIRSPYHSIELICRSFIFLHNNLTWSYFISPIGIFANEIRIDASSVSSAKLDRRWFMIKFCLEKPLTHIVALEGITNTHCQIVCKPSQLVNHPCAVVYSHICFMICPLVHHLTPWTCSTTTGSCANSLVKLFTFHVRIDDPPTHV